MDLENYAHLENMNFVATILVDGAVVNLMVVVLDSAMGNNMSLVKLIADVNKIAVVRPLLGLAPVVKMNLVFPVAPVYMNLMVVAAVDVNLVNICMHFYMYSLCIHLEQPMLTNNKSLNLVSLVSSQLRIYIFLI